MCIGTIPGASDKAVNKIDKSLSYSNLNEVKSSSEPPWSRKMRNPGFAMFIFGRKDSLGVSVPLLGPTHSRILWDSPSGLQTALATTAGYLSSKPLQSQATPKSYRA